MKKLIHSIKRYVRRFGCYFQVPYCNYQDNYYGDQHCNCCYVVLRHAQQTKNNKGEML